MIRFKSLTTNQHAYAWGSGDRPGSLDNSTLAAFDAWQFDVLGDGMTQHSPMYAVRMHNAMDFLYSLAAFLLEHPEEADLSMWPNRYNSKDFAFAVKVKYREDKRQWYSMQESKVSSAESKRNDRRWEEIPSWADGTFDSAFRLLTCDRYHTPLARLAVLVSLSDWWYKTFDHMPWIGKLEDYGVAIPIGDDNGLTWHDVECAFQAVANQVQANFLIDRAKRIVNRYVNNSGR